MPAQIQPKSFESRWNLFFLPMVDVPYVYVHASALCFNSLISTHTFWKALTVSVDRCAEINAQRFGLSKSTNTSVPFSTTQKKIFLFLPQTTCCVKRSVLFFNIVLLLYADIVIILSFNFYLFLRLTFLYCSICKKFAL